MTASTGTPRYMAPEVAKMQDTYGFPADVYSFTILLWQILTNRVPFAKITTLTRFTANVVEGKKRPNLKYVHDDRLRMLIKSGWSDDPSRRPTFAAIENTLQEIIEHLSQHSLSESTSALPRTQWERIRARSISIAKRGLSYTSHRSLTQALSMKTKADCKALTGTRRMCWPFRAEFA